MLKFSKCELSRLKDEYLVINSAGNCLGNLFKDEVDGMTTPWMFIPNMKFFSLVVDDMEEIVEWCKTDGCPTYREDDSDEGEVD